MAAVFHAGATTPGDSQHPAIFFRGLVPAGLYQVNLIVPFGVPPGRPLTQWYTPDGPYGPAGIFYTQ